MGIAREEAGSTPGKLRYVWHRGEDMQNSPARFSSAARMYRYSDGARKRRGQLRYCTFSAPMGTRGSHPACVPKRGANVNAQARGRVDPTPSGVLSGPRRSSPHASRARRGRVGAQHHAIAQDKDELTSLRMALGGRHGRIVRLLPRNSGDAGLGEHRSSCIMRRTDSGTDDNIN